MNQLRAAVVSLRPRQWVKNLFVFAAVTFSQNLFSPLIWPALAAFAIFCALSGAIYLVNDLVDVDKDRQHPVKRYRPIASGTLPRRTAVTFAVVLLLVSLGAADAYVLPPQAAAQLIDAREKAFWLAKSKSR